MRKFHQVAVISSLAFVIAACGSDGGSDDNNAPTVNAGNDVQVNEGVTVNLTATASDTDGSINTFTWSQVSGPTVTLGTTNQASLTITAPSVDADAVVVLRVTVTDNDGANASDDVQLSVKNVATIGISGRVINGVSGAALANVTVSVGDTNTVSDANGDFQLQVAPSERIAIVAQATNFAEQARVLTLHNGQINELVTLKLLPVDVNETFAANAPKTLAVAGTTAAVVLPANAFVDANGAAVTGMINGSLTIIDPRNDPEIMPGDYLGDSGDGVLQNMASLGAITAQFAGSDGKAINLATGVNAQVQIPAQAREGSELPATIPLFYFDATQKKWLQQGAATLVATPTPHYVGDVSHFSTWNADYLYTSIFINGCVQDSNGNPVANIRVTSSGDDYNGTAVAYTDSTGQFHLAARPSSSVLVIASDQYSVSNTVAVQTTTTDYALTPCLRLGVAQATIKLTWGNAPSDLDSHLFTPASEHIYYGNHGDLAQTPFAALDVDDTTGFGPEVITITTLQTGTYRYFVHNYSGTFEPGQIGSPARVELRVDGRTYIYAPPSAEGNNPSWHVFDLNIAANGQITVTGVGQWSNESPQKTTPRRKNYQRDKRFN